MHRCPSSVHPNTAPIAAPWSRRRRAISGKVVSAAADGVSAANTSPTLDLRSEGTALTTMLNTSLILY